MRISHCHDWNINLKQAREIQLELRKRIRFETVPMPVTAVAGLDCAYSRRFGMMFAVVVVMAYDTLQIVEVTSATVPVSFPYVPGYLTFREAPALLAALDRLQSEPDVFIFDGQGIMHPLRMGIASHIGVLIDRPSVGCAKKRLYGNIVMPDNDAGARAMVHQDGEVIGAVLRTKSNVKPVYVSPGHRCTVSDAVNIVRHCVTAYRLPEPTRQAHIAVGKLRQQYDQTDQ